MTKITNLDPPGVKAFDRVKGRSGSAGARSPGVQMVDSSGNEATAARWQILGATVTDNNDETAVLTIGEGSTLIPEATITATKDAGNPTFNFPALVENVIKVGSTYYCPYIHVTESPDIRLATATSRHGPWTAYGGTPIFEITGVAWDAGSTGLYAPEIVEHDGTFYLFYSVILAAGVTGSSNAIGVATCATIDGTYVDSGSAILSPSASGLWDSRRVGEPSVIFHGGQWIMAYMGEDSDIPYQESEQIGIATAPSATGPWTRAAGNPLVPFGGSGYAQLVADPSLFYANGYYWMMFCGSDTTTPSLKLEQYLAYATTPTGAWTVLPDPILTVGASGTWDDTFAFRGGIYYEGGTFSGVYTGNDGSAFKGGNFTLDISSPAIAITPVAADITIEDIGGWFAAGEVESALQEIGADIAVLRAGGAGHYEVIVSGSSPPVAVTNPASTDWLYGFVPE